MLVFEGEFIKYYVGDRLLLNINRVEVHQDDRIGIVGRNGSGKTTLLNIIAKQITLDKGMIHHYTSIKLIPQIKEVHPVKSGGEITQSYLQDAFNHNVGLLLLDEPTTHLDTSHIEWLEKKLINYQGTLVLVSHDREFLNQICTEIWDIEDGNLTSYTGNYDAYMEEKAMKLQAKQLAFERYEKEKEQLEAAIQKKEEKAQAATKKPKNLSASDARQKGAKPYYANKQKKLRKTATAFETRLQQLNKPEKPQESIPIQMDIMNEEVTSNQVILRAEQVSSMIANKIIFNPSDFYIRGGDKIAVIGANGSGKTTLLKKIMNDEAVSISPAVKVGYFAQHLTILQEQKTILENVQSSSNQNETLIRTVLARMHFKADDVYKKVQVLSGGEKVKVALSKIFLSDANMLILDEPTNFLDYDSLEAFEILMKEYPGTVIFATHDRMFIRNVATRILEIDKQRITIFDGNYEQFKGHTDEQNEGRNVEELLLLETKIADVLSRLSIEQTEELEAEFQTLLKRKQRLQAMM